MENGWWTVSLWGWGRKSFAGAEEKHVQGVKSREREWQVVQCGWKIGFKTRKCWG